MRTALLMHGFGQNGSVWDPLERVLPDWHLRSPDLRGHRSAGAERPIDEDALTGDACALGRTLDRPVLVGYSMGGRVALRAVIREPSLWSGLVLVSTTAGIVESPARRARRESDEKLAELLASGDIAGFEEQWAHLPIWNGETDDARKEARSLRSQSNPADLAEVLRGFGSGSAEPVWSELGAVDCPTEVIVGERDLKYRRLGMRLVQSIRGASLNVVPDCGHSVVTERPHAVAEALRRISLRLQPEGS